MLKAFELKNLRNLSSIKIIIYWHFSNLGEFGSAFATSTPPCPGLCHGLSLQPARPKERHNRWSHERRKDFRRNQQRRRQKVAPRKHTHNRGPINAITTRTSNPRRHQVGTLDVVVSDQHPDQQVAGTKFIVQPETRNLRNGHGRRERKHLVARTRGRKTSDASTATADHASPPTPRRRGRRTDLPDVFAALLVQVGTSRPSEDHPLHHGTRSIRERGAGQKASTNERGAAENGDRKAAEDGIGTRPRRHHCVSGNRNDPRCSGVHERPRCSSGSHGSGRSSSVISVSWRIFHLRFVQKEFQRRQRYGGSLEVSRQAAATLFRIRVSRPRSAG